MKRRDFVKLAALLPVAPAMVAVNQLKPLLTTDKSLTPPAKCLKDLEDANRDGCHTEFTYIDTKCPRLDGFWVTFDDVEKQTNFLRGTSAIKKTFGTTISMRTSRTSTLFTMWKQ